MMEEKKDGGVGVGVVVVEKDEKRKKRWDGKEMSQDQLMEKDTVLVLDHDDLVIGSASKRHSHVFDGTQPRGILHRAFSVFLFDEGSGDLLLQQRAASKITFPNVWTNTCCSHPLHGMDPDEVDAPEDVADGTVRGVKFAAVRKLEHELGIPPSRLMPYVDDDQNDDGNKRSPSSSSSSSSYSHRFQFLTRLHYWAADTVTHGPDSPWGEHEIDYVLFLVVPDAKNDPHVLSLSPRPDEVRDVRWVSKTDLLAMMDDKKLLFSPWFRIIVQKWLLPTTTTGGGSGSGGWWEDDLKVVMETSKHRDYDTIHRFDPPDEHLGGAGGAGPLFPINDSANTTMTNTTHKKAKGRNNEAMHDTSKKQGAYGRIPTHKESKLSQALRFEEVAAALTLLYVRPLRSNLDDPAIRSTFPPDDLHFCNDILVKVSRSFASVIRQLPGSSLLVDVMVFYLVLRALDTIEDDTGAFGGSHDEKVRQLRRFHETALVDPHWTMDGVGEGDERRLLRNFDRCHRVYRCLPEPSRVVIADITRRMADGMAEFVIKDMGQGTTDVDEYNRYCHFVAGLVGEGLSRLFAASGLERPDVAAELLLSDRMGLFLQKVNIIRDYLEDYVDGRAWWPQSVWHKYVPSDGTGHGGGKSRDLGYFRNQSDPAVREASVRCLNELVADALELAPHCLEYMSGLRCREVFRFCAIPQVMAIATLDKMYANADVFTGVVKIRKGLSCRLILHTNSLMELHGIFHGFASSIARKARLRQGQRRRQEEQRREPAATDDAGESRDADLTSRTLKACEAVMELTKDLAAQEGEEALAAMKRGRRMLALFVLLLLVAPLHCYDAFVLGSANNHDHDHDDDSGSTNQRQHQIVVIRRLTLALSAFSFLLVLTTMTPAPAPRAPSSSTTTTTLRPARELEAERKKSA